MGWKCPFREVGMNGADSAGADNAQLSTRQNCEIAKILKKQQVKITPMTAGDVFYVGGAEITVIHPGKLAQDRAYGNMGSDKVREILDFIGSEPNIRLQSAGFKAQMPVRNAVERYSETAAAVAVGKEMDALIVLGDPKLAPQLVERYRHLILRVNELETLLGA